MTTAELQNDLINQITGITDAVKLEELLQIVKFNTDKAVYILDDEEKRAVAEARAQIEVREVISNEDFQAEITKWLKQ
jgi:hypothetical protein